MKTFLTAILLSVMSAGAFARDLSHPLPNWIDYSREYRVANRPLPSIREMPPEDFRLPAEYEPVGAVLISWAGYTDMLGAIARAAVASGAEIWAAEGPASIPGVPNERYSQIAAPINTVWARDYGPFGISARQAKVGLVDSIYRHYQYRRNDDAIPLNLGKIKKINVYGLQLIIDGGNIMADSRGNLFMTKRTYIWNSNIAPAQVDAALRRYFRVNNIYSFEYPGYPGEPADGTGHIDMFMKLLNDHTVLISVADTEPFRNNAAKAIAFFKDRTAPDGELYRVIPVKGWEYYGTWYTYTNSLIVNKTVLMPSYSAPGQNNEAAIAAYEAGMPGVRVFPIPADASIGSGGAIHCVTQTIPALPRYQ